MKEKIVTESGSEYIIDYEAKTWSRKGGENAGKIRSEEGTFISIAFVRADVRDAGDCIVMICPPINPPFVRLIQSMPMVSREEIT